MNNNNHSMLDFQSLGLLIPKNVFTLKEEVQKEIYTYLQQLDEQDKKAYIIAYNHLGTSFDICRSNGYKEWKNKKT